MSLDFYLTETKPTEVFWINITHNLAKMADECGIYEALWRPNENNYKYAKDIIPNLKNGLNKLKTNPDFYKTFNASNCWGTYENFVSFVEQTLKACVENPDAEIRVSR